MPKVKFDGIVEAVHYSSDGKVEWVRAYMRRGPTFSDHVLLDRQELMEQLKSGKLIMAGARIPLLASTFQASRPLRLTQKNGRDVLAMEGAVPDEDCLEGVPVI